MTLPFSHDQFLAVFGAYNVKLWPAVLLLWSATVVVAWHWVRYGRSNGKIVFGLLAAHWAWSGVAYHWFYFRTINPVAVVFSALFVGQAGVFAALAIRSRANVIPPSGLRGAIGVALVLYGLAYPFVGFAFGLTYPQLPLFAVPCPTTLVTAGLLLNIRTPRLVGLIPVVWSVVGSSAAFVLAMRADLALVVAGLALAIDMAAPAVLGSRPGLDTGHGPRVSGS